MNYLKKHLRHKVDFWRAATLFAFCFGYMLGHVHAAIQRGVFPSPF